MSEQLSGLLSRRWLLWAMVGCILVVGSYFRLAGLNDTTLHGDAIIHDVCKAGATPSDILTKWEQLVGNTGQLAVPAALTKLFLDVFHLAPTRGNVILPSAFWGILTILAALWVGWRLGGCWFGLLLMSVVSFNPMHVQMSRMAYFYPPSVLGGFLMIWCLVESGERMKAGRRLGWRFHAVHASAIVTLLYSSASAWSLTAVFALVMLFFSFMKWKRGAGHLNEIVVLVATYAVIGAPLLFYSWGVPALTAMAQDNAHRAYGRRIFEVDRAKPIFGVVLNEFSRLGWGCTTVRAMAGGILFAIGCGALAVRIRRDWKWGVPLCAFLIGLLLAVLSIYSTGWPFGLRRVAPIWPFAYVIWAAGLAAPWLVDSRARWKTLIRPVWVTLVIVLLGFWVQADTMALQVNGFPMPYQRIGQWLDSHFPKGTPVVTDRFFTAMCEFNRSDPTTNVVVISTVPNELPEIQEKTRFREVTRQYLEDNPDAVFYCCGHMYERPEIVPWEWPKTYFKRSQEMPDMVAGELGLIGQSYFAAVITRWPIVYYNTVDDVVAIKKAAGSAGFVFWGPQWRPVQTQDYRLWRLLLSADANLEVYGLGAKAQELVLDVTGVAVGGTLRVQVGDQEVVFAANQIAQQRWQVKLQPGMNAVRVRSRGAANAKLLIGRVSVVGKE